MSLENKVNYQTRGKCGKSIGDCSMFNGAYYPCERCTFDSPDLPDYLTNPIGLIKAAFSYAVEYNTPR